MLIEDFEILRRVSRWDSADWFGCSTTLHPVGLSTGLIRRGLIERKENLGFRLTPSGRDVLDRWTDSRRREWNS